MLRTSVAMVLCACLAGGAAAGAETETGPEERLAALEAKLEKAPKKPELHKARACCLMELERWDAGYAAAERVMELYKEREEDLAWFILERIELDDLRVDVHYNMGPRERQPPAMGIAKPLSFRIWSGEGDEMELVDMVDYEISYIGGEPNMGAICRTEGKTHLNYAGIDPKAGYGVIRTVALKVIRKLHLAEAAE